MSEDEGCLCAVCGKFCAVGINYFSNMNILN